MSYYLYWNTTATIPPTDVKVNNASATQGMTLNDGDIITYYLNKDESVINGSISALPLEYPNGAAVTITDSNVNIYGYSAMSQEWVAGSAPTRGISSPIDEEPGGVPDPESPFGNQLYSYQINFNPQQQQPVSTPEPISSFGDLSVVDNDTYITLTINGVSVDVELEPVPSGYQVTFTDGGQWNYYGQDLDVAEYSTDNGSTWVSIPNTLPLTVQANQIMLKLGYGWGGDIKPRAICNDISLDTGYVAVSSQQTSNYTLTNDININLYITYDD